MIIDQVHHDDNSVTIEARAAVAADHARCAGCGNRSGRYQRRLADTPLAGQPVVIQLLGYRFGCTESD